MNIVEIEEAASRIAEAPFEASEFPYQIMAAFGAPDATITRTRSKTLGKSDVKGAVMWRRKMHIAVCSPGDVDKTMALLERSKVTQKERPRYIIATDGVVMSARDMKRDDSEHFDFPELRNKFPFLIAAAGYSRYKAAEENPVDLKASSRLSKIHDALIVRNPDWGRAARRHDLNMFMTRIIFCLFADDTGIFKQGLFKRTINEMAGRDGQEMARVLGIAFTAMNTPDPDREAQGLPSWAGQFPYVNGGLFAGSLDVPDFNREAYRHLIEAAMLDWKHINPDIFGSMIQVIVDPEHRHETGMHYTSVPNILKALDPLFLDELRAEAERKPLSDRSKEKRRLQALLRRLSKIRVFDPACGSGNFLIIAYREMRRIEMRILERLRDLTGEPPGVWSHVELGNFYGIEINDFAAETAKLSLWVARYQQDKIHEAAFGRAAPALPMKDAGRIVTGNALRVDWLDVCPMPMTEVHKEKIFDLATIVQVHGKERVPDYEVETYIVGNPPYLGRAKQTAQQKSDLGSVVAREIPKWKNLDYVSGWLYKASDYVSRVENSSSALVATNSICQGQHVYLLWRNLLEEGIEIGFAHTSFKWTNNAAKNAGVTCVVVGLRRISGQSKTLYDLDYGQVVENITPYLTTGTTVYVRQARRPLDHQLPPMLFGNMPNDGGALILSPAEAEHLRNEEPRSEQFLRRFYGSREFIQGLERWCLWIATTERTLANSLAPISERIDRVREHRLASDRETTVELADQPYRFAEIRGVGRQYTIAVPSVSSERREYLPVGYLEEGCVVSNLMFALYDAPLWTMSLIASRLHLLWIAAVCGKLKTDFRYSNTLGWHTFPVPRLTEPAKAALTRCAENILVTRARLGGSLAKLYDPEKMPDELREVHRVNDETLEALYTGTPFRSDAERLNHLFRRYVRMIAREKGEPVDDEPELDFAEPAE